MDIGELKRDLQHAVDKARQELQRTETPADVDIVAATANHEITVVTKRFRTRVRRWFERAQRSPAPR
jgi:hypothetical protein